MKHKHTLNRIYTVLLILFLIEVILFPIVVWKISGSQREGTEHTIVYKDSELKCDKDTKVDEEGTIILNLLEEGKEDNKYNNSPDTIQVDDVKPFDKTSNDAEIHPYNIIAPGGKKTSVITIKNTESFPLKFDARLFNGSTTQHLPINVSISSDKHINTYVQEKGDIYSNYEKGYINVIEGVVSPGEEQKVEITWQWDYSIDEYQDMLDTELGNTAAFEEPDEVVIGFRIVAEEHDGNYIVPKGPQTGDNTDIGRYIVLMALSLFILILILFEKDKEYEENI